MNKNRLMASGALLAIGAMFPLTAGALSGAEATPEPTTTATATATAAPTITADPLPDCANLKPGDAWAGVGLHCGLNATPSPSAVPTAPTTPTAAPSPTVTTQPAPAPTSAPIRCEEDEPCWDCATMGNMICGTDPAKLEDAWASFDAEKVAGVVGKSIAFRATYIGTTNASSIPGYWVVPSLGSPNTSHVFLIQPGA